MTNAQSQASLTAVCRTAAQNRWMATKTIENAPEVRRGEALQAFGQRLRKARRARKIPPGLLGEYCGVSDNAVRQWENGNNPPSVPNLVAVAELVQHSTDWLLIGGDMDSIDARVRRIPDALRDSLIMRLHDEIHKTEEAAKRLPPAMMKGPVIKDADQRLIAWSAKGKPKKRPSGKK